MDFSKLAVLPRLATLPIPPSPYDISFAKKTPCQEVSFDYIEYIQDFMQKNVIFANFFWFRYTHFGRTLCMQRNIT